MAKLERRVLIDRTLRKLRVQLETLAEYLKKNRGSDLQNEGDYIVRQCIFSFVRQMREAGFSVPNLVEAIYSSPSPILEN